MGFARDFVTHCFGQSNRLRFVLVDCEIDSSAGLDDGCRTAQVDNFIVFSLILRACLVPDWFSWCFATPAFVVDVHRCSVAYLVVVDLFMRFGVPML